MLAFLAITVRQEKERRGINFVKAEVKLSIWAEGIVMCEEIAEKGSKERAAGHNK